MTITDNHADNIGGGLYVVGTGPNSGTAYLNRVIITNNTAIVGAGSYFKLNSAEIYYMEVQF